MWRIVSPVKQIFGPHSDFESSGAKKIEKSIQSYAGVSIFYWT